MIFLPVMDELDLDIEFVYQFEDHNFRILGRLIFTVNSFWFNRQWPLENLVSIQIETSVSTKIEPKGREIKVFKTIFHSVAMHYEVP